MNNRICKLCGNEVSKTSKGLCRPCYNEGRRKYPRDKVFYEENYLNRDITLEGLAAEYGARITTLGKVDELRAVKVIF